MTLPRFIKSRILKAQLTVCYIFYYISSTGKPISLTVLLNVIGYVYECDLIFDRHDHFILKLYIFCLFIIDGYKNKNFGTIFRGKYSIDVHQGANAIGLPIRIWQLNDTEMYNDTLFQDNDIFEFSSYEPEDWDWTFTTNTGKTFIYDTYIHLYFGTRLFSRNEIPSRMTLFPKAFLPTVYC